MAKAALKAPKGRRTDPLTIRLPSVLRSRAERYARSRSMPLAGALRTIISEHLDEVALDEQLTRAERWQRDQAWASARAIADGTTRPASWNGSVLTMWRRWPSCGGDGQPAE